MSAELDSIHYAIVAGFHSPALQRVFRTAIAEDSAEAVLTAIVGEDRIDDVMLEVQRREASITEAFAAHPSPPHDTPRLAALKSVVRDASAGTLRPPRSAPRVVV